MLALIFALIVTVHAQQETIWDVQAQKFISLDELSGAPGDIFVIGERHAFTGREQDPETITHHANKARLIQRLQKHSVVSVGMEFLTYTFQDLVNRFVGGVLPEADFLKQVAWGSKISFQFYRDQILATRGTKGETIALNIPAEITAQVAKGGKDSLSAEQRALLPPFWDRGSDTYFERFSEQMKDHAPADAIERYFWAQSLWDDTMAWRALEHHARNPSDILVVVIGEFHVLFGGGIPTELKKHGAKSVKTVVQVTVPDWTLGSLEHAVAPDPKYGPAADYIWIHQDSEPRALDALTDILLGN